MNEYEKYFSEENKSEKEGQTLNNHLDMWYL